MPAREELTETVLGIAREMGFAAAAAAADEVPGLEAFESWLAAGYNGEMSYLARNAARRFRPASLVPQARSVICLAVGYAPGDGCDGEVDARAFVARYARGEDYHRVLKRRCLKLMSRLGEISEGFVGRAFVDAAPLAERSLAASAGLGWIGRNGCLIVPGLGSYVVLAEIVSGLELSAGRPMVSECGDCGACIRACPTGALRCDALVDARRCLSYQTVEHRGPVDRTLRPAWGRRVFGCDSCQEVCPHNKSLGRGDWELVRRPPGRAGMADVEKMTIAGLLSWRRQDWDAATRGSAMRRATLEMFLRNATIAAGCSRDASLVEPLRRLRARQPELADAIDWALAHLGSGR